MLENKIHLGNCIDLLKDIDDSSINLILTDPPYNASNSTLGDDYYNRINEEWDKKFTIWFFDLAWYKLKVGGQMMIFCSHQLLPRYLAKKEPFQILHWHKTNAVPAMSDRYGYSIEYILWYIRTSKDSASYTFNKGHRPHYLDIFTDKVATYKKTDHPAEKPLHLIEALVKTHSNKGDLVLDPFSGSGTTAVACAKTERRCIAIEILPKYYEMSLKRMEIETKQPSLWETK